MPAAPEPFISESWHIGDIRLSYQIDMIGWACRALIWAVQPTAIGHPNIIASSARGNLMNKLMNAPRLVQASVRKHEG